MTMARGREAYAVLIPVVKGQVGFGVSLGVGACLSAHLRSRAID